MCEQFLASDRVLEELELEPLTVPESAGDVETAEPEPAEEAVEDDEEPPSSFAHPISTRMMKLSKDSKQILFFIATPKLQL